MTFDNIVTLDNTLTDSSLRYYFRSEDQLKKQNTKTPRAHHIKGHHTRQLQQYNDINTDPTPDLSIILAVNEITLRSQHISNESPLQCVTILHTRGDKLLDRQAAHKHVNSYKVSPTQGHPVP